MNRSNALLYTVLITSVVYSSAASSHKPVTEAVISTFLQERQKSIKRIEYWSTKEVNVVEKIFDTQTIAHAHDVEMTIKSEGMGESAVVVIVTMVKGCNADFENEHIFEAEGKMLKYILLKGYLERLNEAQSGKHHLAPLDEGTKVFRIPFPMVHVKKNGYAFYKEEIESEEYKSMEFVTVLKASEFDEYIKQYFPILQDQANAALADGDADVNAGNNVSGLLRVAAVFFALGTGTGAAIAAHFYS